MKRDSSKTKQQASGRWLDILPALAPSLKPACDNVPNHVPCPIGTGSTDGFRLFKDAKDTGGGVSNVEGVFPDGFSLLMWVNDWKFPECHDAVSEWLNGAPVVREPVRQVSCQQKNEVSDAENAKKRRYLLNKLWSEAHSLDSIDAEPAMSYLAKRRCFPLPWDIPTLSFHKSLQYKDEQGNVQYFPGLLAVVQDRDGNAVTMHRTFLTMDGRKAPVAKPKRMMPIPQDAFVTGSAIRLQPANWEGEVIGIAEGIETALCVSCATNTVCWAATSSTFLATFEPPQWVKKVIIWADHDKEKITRKGGKLVDLGSAGLKAAQGLQLRLDKLGIESEIRLPPLDQQLIDKKGIDWADIYALHGSAALLERNVKKWA